MPVNRRSAHLHDFDHCPLCGRDIYFAAFIQHVRRCREELLKGDDYGYGTVEERQWQAPSPAAGGARVSEQSGAARIAAERQRQITKENWTAEHDDGHDGGELALAAVCYATPVLLFKKQDYANSVEFNDPWPWEERWDTRPHDGNVVKPNDPFYVNRGDRIRQLEKAGALIAAEIDRILRLPQEARGE